MALLHSPNSMYDVTFYFSYVQEVLKILNTEFNVEFDEKKNCVFSFFHIFKIRGARKIQLVANYGLTNL